MESAESFAEFLLKNVLTDSQLDMTRDGKALRFHSFKKGENKMRLWTDTEVLEKLEKQLTDLVGDYHREIRRMEDKKEQTQQILSNLKMMRAAQNQ
jgi:protein associated with RNAse G/E